MVKLIGWLATACTLILLLWWSVTTELFWLRVASDALLILVSVLAGMRVATDASTGYVRDLYRLNKVVTNQNQELQEANAMLLSEIQLQSQRRTNGG